MARKSDQPSNQSKVIGSLLIFLLLLNDKNFLSFDFIDLASSRKRRKGNSSNHQDPQPKNAVAILNELKKNLVYELESQEGEFSFFINTQYSRRNLIVFE